MEHNDTSGSITLLELWEVFVGRLWAIVIVGIVAFGAITAFTVATYRAEYTSTATIYLVQQKTSADNTAVAPSTSDFSLALNTVNDSTRTFKSHRVLDAVISELRMRISHEALSDMITIENPPSTRFLEISVTTYLPTDSKIIVDKLCEIGAETMIDVMGIDQVNIVDYGTYSEEPSNSPIGVVNFAVALTAAAVVYVICLLTYMFGDSIGTPDDIERYFGLSVLGVIPNAGAASANKKGKRGKRRGGKHTARGKKRGGPR